MKKLSSAALIVAVFLCGVIVGQQKKVASQPKTIIHFVSLKWKADVSDAEQVQEAVDE